MALLTEELQAHGLGEAGGETERLKAKNKELRRLLQESEDQLSAFVSCSISANITVWAMTF